jgi:hypothetical protein
MDRKGSNNISQKNALQELKNGQGSLIELNVRLLRELGA